MAEGKKSFTAYCDWQETFKSLPDDKAGQLIKHLFAYVNDENPETDDILIKAVFAQLKATLKRDLKKWETTINERSRSGILGNLKRYQNDLYDAVISDVMTLEEAQKVAKGRIAIQSDTKLAVSDSVSVSVSDSVKEIKKKDIFIFKNALIDAGAKEDLVSDWLKVRKTKKATNTKTAFNGFLKQIEKTSKNINEVLEVCINNSWAGFKSEWLENQEAKPSKKTANGLTKNSNGTYNVI